MSTRPSLSQLIAALATVPFQHARTTALYQALDPVALSAVRATAFTGTENARETIEPFGVIELPFHRMGAVDSLNLHSILMGKCGWQVCAYEPDPKHAALLKRNLALNQSHTVELVEAAVSDKPGTLEFVRVLGNTTSSHLSGAKSSAYGELEKIPVRVEAIADIMPTVDFVKMDAEGQEKIIILGTTAAHWDQTDMMVELGTAENARAIFDHLQKLGVRAFAQKLGWSEVKSLADMPTSYKDGSLFITRLAAMPWF